MTANLFKITTPRRRRPRHAAIWSGAAGMLLALPLMARGQQGSQASPAQCNFAAQIRPQAARPLLFLGADAFAKIRPKPDAWRTLYGYKAKPVFHGKAAFTRSMAQPDSGFRQAQPPKTHVPPRGLRTREWAYFGAAAGAGLGAGMAGAGSSAARRARVSLVYGAIGAALAAGWHDWRHPDLEHQPQPDRGWPRPGDWALAAGIAGVQVLDYLGTRDFRRQQYPEWLLTNGIVDHRGELAATDAAAGLAALSVAFLLHRAGHDGWARIFSLSYIGAGLASYYNNRRYARTGVSWFNAARPLLLFRR